MIRPLNRQWPFGHAHIFSIVHNAFVSIGVGEWKFLVSGDNRNRELPWKDEASKGGRSLKKQQLEKKLICSELRTGRQRWSVDNLPVNMI